jgi:hypothetical protein
MEAELDGRVHFSDNSDPFTGSRHAAVLHSLGSVEQVRLRSLKLFFPASASA